MQVGNLCLLNEVSKGNSRIFFLRRNKEHGCNRKCRRVELSDHEGSCKHQPVPCFDPTCHHMLSIHGLVKHAREKHKENVELDMVTPQVTIQYKVIQILDN